MPLCDLSLQSSDYKDGVKCVEGVGDEEEQEQNGDRDGDACIRQTHVQRPVSPVSGSQDL